MRTRQPKYPTEITFTVYGHAIPKARARVVGVGSHAKKTTKDGKPIVPHAFTPKRTEEWEASVYGQSLASKPPFPWDGPIALGVAFFKRIPKSASKKKREQMLSGERYASSARDDFDNMLKSIKDALNGIYWMDDGQVCEMIPVNGRNSGKYFSDLPRVEILVRFLKQPD
jgi:Holliday junction resolvase RusA-like endonuclease